MTNEEFDQQKQAIYNQIIHLVNGDHDGDIEDQVELIKIQLSELQPPRLPTCATCKHFSNYIDHKKCECGKSAKFCQEIIDPQKYVCIKHSGYGDAK